MAHFSRFVLRGSHSISHSLQYTSINNVEANFFINPEGVVVAIIMNNDSSDHVISISDAISNSESNFDIFEDIYHIIASYG